MTIRRGFLNWGVFLICLGTVPLAIQLGLLDADVAAELLRLWPLILIGIGLGLLLRLTPYAAIGGLVVAATFGVLLGTLLGGGVPGAVRRVPEGRPAGRRSRATARSAALISASESRSPARRSMSRASRARPGHVDVAAGDEQPTIDATVDELNLRSDTAAGWGPFGGDSRERWNVSLPAEPGSQREPDGQRRHGQLRLQRRCGEQRQRDLQRGGRKARPGRRRHDTAGPEHDAQCILPGAGLAGGIHERRA